MDVRRVADDQWDIVAWLWQAFRNDLAPVVDSFPQPDGRYNTAPLEGYPGVGREGWIAWAPHPNLGAPAPIGFALVSDLATAEQSLAQFFVVPAARRTGVGRRLAAYVLAQHPGPWRVGFQHENPEAGAFWRRVFCEAFGADGWVESRQAVEHKPQAPADHWIRTR
ncbi:hypothetical protein [Nocardioides sp.]|uniref:hypothetical protein n=1 Tax=Nocardioides sp. TaxID=35761 RepID=UPI003D115D9D